MRPAVFEPVPLDAYELLDSGAGEKLERFGEVVLRRPDPQALWRARLSNADWERADLRFIRESDRGGRWQARKGAHPSARSKSWALDLCGARVWIRPTPFKHVGLFPEQASTWELVERVRPAFDGRPALLNLFAYTGAASLAAARAGYDVTHVDASKASIGWAKENAELSGVADGAIRWVLEDALAFARREARRGARYQGILLDPPHYGRGPKGEKWQLEEDLAPLVESCEKLLAARAFLVLSTYAVGYSPLALVNLLEMLAGGAVEAGELALPERRSSADRQQRWLPCGFCARWLRGIGAER